MPLKKIIFLGSKPIGYECLAYLIEHAAGMDAQVTGVLTRQRKEFGGDHDLGALAVSHNIPLYNTLDDMPECDIIYSVQYHEILKQRHIDKARQIAVNLHMAPLPEYRGANQFSFAIIEEKEEFGATLHCIDTGIDSGDILFQKRFRIPQNCWVEELYQLTYKASLNLFRQTLAHIVAGNYKRVPQSLLVGKYGTSLHYKKEMEQLKLIDLKWDAEKRDRYIRATSMPGFEPPYAIVNGGRVYFTRQNTPGD